MALIAGNVVVAAVDGGGNPVTSTSTGLAGSLFTARYPALKTAFDNADTANAGASRGPDPAKVQAFLRADIMTNGPLIAGYSTAVDHFLDGDSWPNAIRVDPLPPIDRLPGYRGLAAECKAFADGVIPYLTANAVITPGTFAAGGDAVTGAGGLS